MTRSGSRLTDRSPGFATWPALLLSLSACTMLGKGGASAGGEPGASTARVTTSRERPAEPTAEPPKDPMPVVTPESAHPTIAWFVGKTGEVPGFAMGGTGAAAVPPGVSAPFILDRAVATIAPACLRDYSLPKTAAVLAALPAITDAASVAKAKAVIGELMTTSGKELEGKDYSDKANGEGAAERVKEALDQLVTATEVALAQPSVAPRADLLRGWYDVLDVCFDSTRPDVIERVLGQYVVLLKTGKPPGRTKRVPVRHVHPAIATYIRLTGERAPVGELARLLATDVGDTLRGSNANVTLFTTDIAVRELAPRMLELCGATAEAAMVRKAPAIKNAASFEKAVGILMGLDGNEGPDHLCINMTQNHAGNVIEEASDAQSAVRQDINSHPYYARGAMSGWVHFISGFADVKMPIEEREQLANELLVRAVKKLRTMPKRSETSREPE